MENIAGLACEMILTREICFIEPPSLIWTPEIWRKYRLAVECNDGDFLASWCARPHLSRTTQPRSKEEWKRLFSPQGWGCPETKEAISEALADRHGPHVILPPDALSQKVREQVDWAMRQYVDTDVTHLPERAWWVMGCLQNVIESGSRRYFPLLLACNEVRWREATHDDVRADSFFRDCGERIRHLLCLMKAEVLDEQVPVSLMTGVHGRADFVVNHNSVLELKASARGWDTAWNVQAALYAYALKHPTAHVFNVLNGHHEVITFDENLFY